MQIYYILVRERNSKTAPMGGEISVGDLLTMRKLIKTQMQHLIYISTNAIYQAQRKLV